MDVKDRYERDLSYISKYIGQDESLVQAGGGNTSVKIDDCQMLVKSSGIELSAVTEHSGFSVVNYCKIREDLKKDICDESSLDESLIDGARPSIETFLHSLTGKYTIHSHPLCVTILASQRGGMDILSRIFPEAVCVNYAKPGLDLAKLFLHALKEKPSASLFFLKNHGVIVCANTKEDVLKKHDNVIKRLCEYLDIPQDASSVAKCLFDGLQSWDNKLIAYHMEKINARDLFRNNGKSSFMFSPDCIVYCGMEFFVAKSLDSLKDEIDEFVKQYGMPKIAVVNDMVFAIAQSVRKAKEIESVLGLVTKINQRKIENVDYLAKDEAIKLLNWNAEKYRYNRD
jgi:ribulose-5-phosphate 4-epimerase/fuculose-1-phosphate aldolase